MSLSALHRRTLMIFTMLLAIGGGPLSGQTRSLEERTEPSRQRILELLIRTSENSQDTAIHEEQIEIIRGAAADKLLSASFEAIHRLDGILEPEDDLLLLKEVITLLESIYINLSENDFLFDGYCDLLVRAGDRAVHCELFAEAHELIDRLDAVIGQRSDLLGPSDPKMLTNQVQATRVRIDAYLKQGLLDLAAGELHQARQCVKLLREVGSLDLASESSLLTIETLVLNSRERFEDLARKIEEAQAEHEWARDNAALTLRLATAHWWLADQYAEGSEKVEAETLERHRDEAKHHFTRAIEIAADPRTIRTARRLFCHSLLSALQLDRAAIEIEIYAQRVEEASDLSDHRMLPFLRARLARELNDPERKARSRLETQRAVESTIEQWRTQPLRKGGRGLLHYAEVRSLLLEQLLHANEEGGARAALAAWLQVESTGSLVRELGAPIPTVEQVQTYLGSRGAMICLASRDLTVLLTVDSSTVSLHRLPPRFPIEQLRSTLMRELRHSPSLAENPKERRKVIEEASTRLGRLLFPPAVDSWLTKQTAITIIDVDSLDFVPFSCLKRRDGRTLGTQLAIGRASSLTAEMAFAERVIPDSESTPFELRIVTDPEYGPESNLIPLPLDASQRSRLIAPYSAGRTMIIERENATLESLLMSNDALILLCLTHGGRMSSKERFASLRLAPSAACPDGNAGVDHFKDLQSSPLALVFACEGGRGPQRAGDAGVTELGGAFLRGGARAVVTAVECIEFQPTLRLSEEFQRSITAGRSPAEALRDARRALALDPLFDDPAYSAFLTIHGDAHTPILPPLNEYDAPRVPSRGFRGTGWLLGSALCLGILLVQLLRVRQRSRTS